MPHFECGAFDHSATSPRQASSYRDRPPRTSREMMCRAKAPVAMSIVRREAVRRNKSLSLSWLGPQSVSAPDWIAAFASRRGAWHERLEERAAGTVERRDE